MTEIRMTGGCQCGTVRFALHGKPFDPCICHCRMCQKQFGNYFGAFASIDEKYFEITQGKIALTSANAAFAGIAVRLSCINSLRKHMFPLRLVL